MTKEIVAEKESVRRSQSMIKCLVDVVWPDGQNREDSKLYKLTLI